MGQGRHTLRSVSDPVYPPLSYFIFLHFIYLATMVACYSIPGFNPKEITHSFKFMRT